VVHAFVANILKAPVDNRLKAHAQGLEPLVGFVARLDGLLSESDAGHP